MPISQDKLGRLVMIRGYRWAVAGVIFWSTSVAIHLILIVASAVTGRSFGVPEIWWLALSVMFLAQCGISLLWHRRERAASRWEAV